MYFDPPVLAPVSELPTLLTSTLSNSVGELQGRVRNSVTLSKNYLASQELKCLLYVSMNLVKVNDSEVSETLTLRQKSISYPLSPSLCS